jgi:hypothetical protein
VWREDRTGRDGAVQRNRDAAAAQAAQRERERQQRGMIAQCAV